MIISFEIIYVSEPFEVECSNCPAYLRSDYEPEHYTQEAWQHG